ncbi:MAG: helix-turn-helix domain-containing protein [Clostridia bacterium]|nr:helix-turn-helix domain-containing protein [Clostridia bacterium]
MRFLKRTYFDNDFLDCCVKKLPTANDSIHFHDFFEIEYVSSGSGTYLVDGKEHEITPGKICLVSPVTAHAFLSNDAELTTISFSDTLCDGTLLSQFDFANSSVWMTLNGEDKDFVEANLKELVTHKKDTTYATLLLNTLIAKIGKAYTQESCSSNDFSPIKQAMLYITANFKRNISREDAASHAGLTPSYFSALLKEEVGMSFQEYLDSLRFNHAQLLLYHSDRTVQQIGFDSGFSNYENFIRRFTARYGMSPKKYREASKEHTPL